MFIVPIFIEITLFLNIGVKPDLLGGMSFTVFLGTFFWLVSAMFFKKGGFGWFYNKSGWFWVISGGSNSFWGVPYFSMYLNDLTTFEFMFPLIL